MELAGQAPRAARWRAWAGVAAIVAILAGTAIALGVSSTARSASPQPTGAAVEAGRELYLQSCASCHGEQAQGGPNGPGLTGVGLASWSFQLRTGRMPLAAPDETAYRQEPRFSGDQIAALLAFAGTVTTGGPGIPQVDVANGSLQQGWVAYIENCAACHAATGAGDAIGGGMIAPSLLESDPETIGEAILVGPGAMPAFPFLEPQINSIAAYVQRLQASETNPGGISIGGLGPVAEGFVAVVFGLGSLVLFARWVERRRASWQQGGQR